MLPLTLLLALFLAACDASPRFEGALRDAVSGAAVADAQVHIADQVVAVDGDGRFAIELPTGEHQGRIIAVGYVETPLAISLTEEARRQNHEIALQPRMLRGQVTLADTGEPLQQGLVQYGDETLTLDQDGAFETPAREILDLAITCEGCIALTLGAGEVQAAFAPDGSLAAPLAIQVSPQVLEGVVREPDGAPVEGARVRLGDQATLTNAEGRYRLRLAQTGLPLEVESPAHKPVEPVIYAGQPSLEIVLEPWQAVIQIVDQASELPLEGASVSSGELQAVSDAQGRATLRLPPGSELTVAARGYLTATALYEGEPDALSLALRATRIMGTLHNLETGAPVANGLVQVFRQGREEPDLLRTDDQGAFEILDGEDVTRLFVKAAGYDRVDLPVTQMGRYEIELEPFVAHGIYIPMAVLSLPDRIYELLDMVAASELLNTIVIDVKGDWATTAWASEVPVAQEIGTAVPGLMDIEEVLQACRERGIYAIARIVVFKDRLLGEGKPEWAIHTQSGALYKDGEGLYWGDPFRQEVWDYNIALMLEAVDKGFDEVQFDYLRFPSEGRVSDRVYVQEATFESRTQAIGDFCAAAYRAIEPTPAFLSADIFGLTPWVDATRDMGIGQRVDDIAPHMDYLSPMLYPTTFNRLALQPIGVSDAWTHPYETVYYSMMQLHKRTDTLVRPWLQHYALGVPYALDDYLRQRKGAEDAGSHGWLWWNAAARYNLDALAPDPYHLMATIPQPPTPTPEPEAEE
jgi:hypothetical protein